MEGAMKAIRLSTVGAISAIGLVVCFVLGAVAMGTSGVSVLIPETGKEGLDWIADVDQAGALFYVGAWLIILMGFLGIVALVGFYDALRDAGPIMILAPVLAVVGLTLVTASHLIPIALGYELVPAYAAADTLASIALVTNSEGNFLGWGIVLPMYSVAILTTRALPRWIGWLGLLVGLLAGWLGMLSPVSDVFGGISTIGFLGFLVFMLSMGIALLIRRRRAELGGVRGMPAAT